MLSLVMVKLVVSILGILHWSSWSFNWIGIGNEHIIKGMREDEIKKWREAMLEWSIGQMEDGIIYILDEQGDLIREYTSSSWEEYINSIDSIEGIKECFYDLQFYVYCLFKDFLNGELYWVIGVLFQMS